MFFTGFCLPLVHARSWHFHSIIYTNLHTCFLSWFSHGLFSGPVFIYVLLPFVLLLLIFLNICQYRFILSIWPFSFWSLCCDSYIECTSASLYRFSGTAVHRRYADQACWLFNPPNLIPSAFAHFLPSSPSFPPNLILAECIEASRSRPRVIPTPARHTR